MHLRYTHYIYRVNPTHVEVVDKVESAWLVQQLIEDHYLYDSAPGERYFVVELCSGKVVAQYEVVQTKTLRRTL